jgi:hypothetical protein
MINDEPIYSSVVVLMQEEINSNAKTLGWMFARDKVGNVCSSAIHLSHSATGSTSVSMFNFYTPKVMTHPT